MNNNISNHDRRALLPIKAERNAEKKTNVPEKISHVSYSVAHAIPGRIRFRIYRLVKDSEYASKLKRLMELDSRVTSVRVNSQAASIVINYKTNELTDDKLRFSRGDATRSHLVYLIQNAENITLPSKITVKSVVATIFDAGMNLIDSFRNLNQARNAIVHQEFKKDIWERLLGGAKTSLKGLKSALMFVLPKSRLSSKALNT